MFCVILAALAFAFTACGDQGGGTDPVDTNQPANNATPAATPTPTPTPAPVVEEPEEIEVVYPDLGGRVIRISTQERGIFGFLGPLHAEENAFRDADPESPHYFRESMQIANRSEVEELFNIVIEPIHTSGGQFVNVHREAAMAGELVAEIWEASGGQNFIGATSGYILPLDVLAEELYEKTGATLSFMTDRNTSWPWLEFDGHVWSIGRPLPTMSNFGLLLNMDIIEQFGAPNPIELYDRGEWTWDAMRQVMEMTTRDTTGDGTPDIWGISGSIPTMIGHFIIANGGRFVKPDTLTLGHTYIEAMEAMEFVYEIMTNWWRPGDPDAEFPTRGGHNDMFFREGVSAIGVGWPGILGNIMDAGEEINYNWVAFPAGPRNTDGITTSGGLRNGVMIMEGTEDPHYLLWILDELFAWPGDDWYDLEFTYDMDWARRFMPDEEAVQRLFEIGHSKVHVDIGSFGGLLGSLHNDLSDVWFSGEMTVAQSVEHWRAERQAFIDEFFGE
jgi:multiple sugar transport system substrate-binding protein